MYINTFQSLFSFIKTNAQLFLNGVILTTVAINAIYPKTRILIFYYEL